MKKDFSELVYKCVRQDNYNADSLDIQTMNILWAMDGKRTLGDIARDHQYDPDALIEEVDRLAAAGFIEVLPQNGNVAGSEFILFLTEELAWQIGPIATFVLGDAAREMACELTRFPLRKVPELINRISKEILSVEAAEYFKARMAAKINANNCRFDMP